MLQWWTVQQALEALNSMTLLQSPFSPHSLQWTSHCLDCPHDLHQSRWWIAQMSQRVHRQSYGWLCPSNSAVHALQLANERVQDWSWIWQELQQHRQCLALWWVPDTLVSQPQRYRDIGTFLQPQLEFGGKWRWIDASQGSEWIQACSHADHAPGGDWWCADSGRGRGNDWGNLYWFPCPGAKWWTLSHTVWSVWTVPQLQSQAWLNLCQLGWCHPQRQA